MLRAFLPHKICTESNPDSLKSNDEISNEIKDHLLSVAENVVKDDFSIPPELFEFKVGLAKHVHSGFTTIEQVKSQFEKDILVLKPRLDEIDVHIDSLMLENPTIFKRWIVLD